MTTTSLTLQTTTSSFVDTFHKEFIDWEILIKMLLCSFKNDTVLNKTVWVDANGRQMWFKNEQTQILEILKLGCKSPADRKNIETLPSTKPEQFYELLGRLYHHRNMYLESHIKVKYFYDNNKTIGRVYPNKSLSLCTVRRELRHHLSRGHYIDIDMVNAHFVIADQIFNKDVMRFPILHDYVVNRNMYLDLLGKHFRVQGYCDGLDYTNPSHYDELKTCFIRILYFGRYMSWVRESNLPELDPPEFLVKLKQEFDTMAAEIKSANPDLVSILDKESRDNPDGTILSWFLQEYERRILECIYSFLHKRKQIKNRDCILCYDGIMIVLNDKNKDSDFLDKLLRDCEVEISKKIGLSIQLKAKAFDNTPYTELLEDMEIPFIDDNTQLIEDKNDKQASDLIYDSIKNDFFLCNKQYYIKDGNIWTNDSSRVDNLLFSFVLNSGIKTTTEKGKIKTYAQYTCHAKHLVDCLKAIASQHPRDYLSEKFITSSVGKLCYRDGVLFFPTAEFPKGRFLRWNDPYFENPENTIYSTLAIDSEFGVWFDSLGTGNEWDVSAEMKEIETKLFKNILEEQADKMLSVISRGIAGYYEDKTWGLWTGSRNCGKGCIATLLMTAFGSYIANLPATCLMVSRITTTDTKAFSWLLDLQGKRMAIVQEIDKKEGQKMNGTAIKSIASGGDIQKARRNHQDETDFTLTCFLLMMCNEMMKCEPANVLESCIQFNSAKQFKSSAFIENTRQELLTKCEDIDDEERKCSIMSSMNQYLLADDSIKTRCRSHRWGVAFTLLLIKKFVHSKMEPSRDDMEDLQDTSDSVENDIDNAFLFTNDHKNDRLTNNEIKHIWMERGWSVAFGKLKSILKARCCQDYKGTGGVRGISGLRRVETQPETTPSILSI